MFPQASVYPQWGRGCDKESGCGIEGGGVVYKGYLPRGACLGVSAQDVPAWGCLVCPGGVSPGMSVQADKQTPIQVSRHPFQVSRPPPPPPPPMATAAVGTHPTGMYSYCKYVCRSVLLPHEVICTTEADHLPALNVPNNKTT